MSISYWLDHSDKSKTQTFDAVIIGAGIAGASAAYWLHKKDPTLKIAVVERDRIAFGASGRNAGFITCGSVEHFNRLVERWGLEKAYKIWDFSEENLRLLKQEIIQDDKTLGFEQKGSFSLASSDNELSELIKTAGHMKELKIPVEIVDGEDIEKRLGAVNFTGGIKYVSDASVNPHKMVTKIFNTLGDKIKVFERNQVFKIEEAGDIRRVSTDQHVFECNMVVMATNGYSPSLLPFFADKIFPTRGQILIFEPLRPFMEGPCYANFVLDYFRQLPSGELLIGGFRQIEKETEVGYSDHTTEKIQKALYEFVQKYLPRFKDGKITHRWAGIMGFSADGQPMVGSLPNDPQTFFTGGFTGHGLGLAFHCGKCLADVAFGEEIPDFLNARRF